MLKEIIHGKIKQMVGNPLQAMHIGGGCIHNGLRVKTTNGDVFVKFNSSDQFNNFQAEVKGLNLLKETGGIHTPNIIDLGKGEGLAWIIMEFVESGPSSSAFFMAFADALAHLHQKTDSNFGLSHDNFIGRLPQQNEKHESWFDFFRNYRILPQLRLARSYFTEKEIKQLEHLLKQLESLIPDERPALLHGDLWSGNYIPGVNGSPVLIDPAVYYGHRETEIAFTQLFGGFSRPFYERYQEVYPLEPGFDSRADIHNLYPLLVHVNLFGESYMNGIRNTLSSF